MARIAVLLLLFGFEYVAFAEPPRVEVEKLADNVYLFTYEAHRSLFVVF